MSDVFRGLYSDDAVAYALAVAAAEKAVRATARHGVRSTVVDVSGWQWPDTLPGTAI